MGMLFSIYKAQQKKEIINLPRITLNENIALSNCTKLLTIYVNAYI